MSSPQPSMEHVFAGVPVADYAAALSWYERLLGAPDVIVKADEAMWQLADTGWVYVVADAARAGNALVTTLVDDLDEFVAGLNERGIVSGTIETVPGRYRKVTVVDPDGNTISFGEPLLS